MGKVGFEPTWSLLSRFTVCRLQPLDHFPFKKKNTPMPQLDIVSYFTQFFWLALTITTFYITLLKFYLPKITRILKVREHKVSLAQKSTASPYAQEQQQVLHTMQKAVRKSVTHSKRALQQSFETTAAWVDRTVLATHQGHFQTVQTHFQERLGTEITAHNRTKNQLKTLLPMSAYIVCGFTHHGHTLVQAYFLRKLVGTLTSTEKMGKKVPKKKR